MQYYFVLADGVTNVCVPLEDCFVFSKVVLWELLAENVLDLRHTNLF